MRRLGEPQRRLERGEAFGRCATLQPGRTEESEGTPCDHRAILAINRVLGPGILLDAVHRPVGNLGETKGERDPCRLLVFFPRWRCDIVRVRPSPPRSGLHDW